MTRKTSCILVSVVVIAFLISCTPVAATETWLDETITVNALTSYAYYGTLTQNDTMTVQINVTSGKDITLYIMNQGNYSSYVGGLGFYYLVSKPDVVSTTFTWQVPANQTYYFVLDNKDSLTSATVHVTITYEETGGGSSAGSPLTSIVFLIALGLIIFVAIALVAIFITRSRKDQSAVRSEPISKSTRIM